MSADELVVDSPDEASADEQAPKPSHETSADEPHDTSPYEASDFLRQACAEEKVEVVKSIINGDLSRLIPERIRKTTFHVPHYEMPVLISTSGDDDNDIDMEDIQVRRLELGVWLHRRF